MVRALNELQSGISVDTSWEFYGGFSDPYIHSLELVEHEDDQRLEPFEKWADEHLEED